MKILPKILYKDDEALTVKELKKWLSQYPDDFNGEVWVEGSCNRSNAVYTLSPLNTRKDSSDIILSVNSPFKD